MHMPHSRFLFWRGWVNFSSSPFSLSWEQQHWPAALQRSEMIKTALPRGRLPAPLQYWNNTPCRVSHSSATESSCWPPLLLYFAWRINLAPESRWLNNTLSDLVEWPLPSQLEMYSPMHVHKMSAQWKYDSSRYKKSAKGIKFKTATNILFYPVLISCSS